MSESTDISHRLEVVNQFWQQQVAEDVLKRPDGACLAHMHCTPANCIGSIVISSGRIECYLKYQEVIFDLFNQGFQVFALDHRGQGLSGRCTDNKHKGHIGDFNDYVDDLRDFCRQIVEPLAKYKPQLLCHSMGSAIGALYLLHYPEHFHKAVFCAPMFGINLPIPVQLTQMIASALKGLNRAFDKQPWYFPGQKDYDPVSFADNELTHSPSRYQWFRQLYRDYPQVQLGGITATWLIAALNAMALIQRRASLIKTPVLILQADQDSVVDNQAQSRVASLLPNCELVTLAPAKHEILMESDAIRSQALNRIFDFFTAT